MVIAYILILPHPDFELVKIHWVCEKLTGRMLLRVAEDSHRNPNCSHPTQLIRSILSAIPHGRLTLRSYSDFLWLNCLFICLFLIGSPALAANQKLPEIDGKKIVATVNEEPITLEELNRATAVSHETRSMDAKAGRIDFSKVINRLINTRLIVLEARNMGLDELPEIKESMAVYSRRLLMEMLLEDYVKDIQVNDEEVDPVYQSLVREWKLKSIVIKKEADAKKIESQLKAGRNFDEVASKAVEWGIAEADPKGEYLKNQDLTLPVAQIVADMSIGSVSPVLSIGKKGFIIFKLEDKRIPAREDPQARAKARRQALNNKRVKATTEYYSDLKKRNAKIDLTLLDTLDFESKTPGFDALLKDERVLAQIEGEKPITVGELSAELKRQFYHGIQRAIDTKMVNSRKYQILDDMIQKRLLLKEALRKGIDKTDEYAHRVKQHERSLVFGAFVDKVITSNIKLDIQELKTYYEQNPAEFATPQMIRIKALAFRQRDDAVQAFNKLKKGTDFDWLGANAEGQVDRNSRGLLNFDGRLLTQSGLPEDIQEVVSKAGAGDYKLYQSPEGYFYVLYINQIVPPQPQPFEAVSKDIAEKVFNEKVKTEIEQWAAQLKEYYPVKIYQADLMK